MKIISEVGRSLVVGVTGVALNLGLLYVLTDFMAVYYLTAALLANIVTMLYIFLGDRYYTFRSIHGSLEIQFMKYVLVYIASNLSSVALLAFFVEFFSLHYLVAQTIATTLISFVTFLIFKYWIFHCYEWF